MRSKDPQVACFRNNLMAHIAAHDNFKFTSGSVVGKLRSKYFSKINEVYKNDLKEIIFAREENFNEIFKEKLGKEHYEVMRDFIKFFFIDKRNRRKVKDAGDSLFSYKDANDDRQKLDVLRVSDTRYVVEVPSGVSFNKVATPTTFKIGKDAVFIKSLVQFRVPSIEDPLNYVTSILYEHVPTFNTSPKVVAMQYEYETFFDLVNRYRALVNNNINEESDQEFLSDDNDGVSSDSYEREDNENSDKILVPDYMMDKILSMNSVQDINNEIKRLTAENYIFDNSQIETIKVKRQGLEEPKPATINIYSTLKNGFEKLSNLLNGPVTAEINGKLLTFKTVEHLYQTKKALFAGDNETANKIYTAVTGWDAQKISREVKNLDSQAWDSVSSRELEDSMRLAFEQNEEARNLLISTGNAILTHKKENANLGKWETEFPRILTEIRSELQPEGPIVDKQQAQGETPEEYTTNPETTSDEEVAAAWANEFGLSAMSEEQEDELNKKRQEGFGKTSFKIVEENPRIQELADALLSKIIDNFDDNYYQLSTTAERLGMNIESVQDIENMSFEDRMKLLDNICK